MTKSLTIALCGSAALLAAACSRPAAADDGAKKGVHGDALPAVQLDALSQLSLHQPGTPPKGVDPVAWAASIPKDNQMNPARVELGKKLYFDLRLSKDGTVSCATCHDVTRSFTDRRTTSEGIAGQTGQRNAPTTMNAALLGNQFWDGRAATLEDQAKLPITNPIEMGMPNNKAAVNAIKDDPEYKRMFKAAYGRDVNFEDLARAIAAFERTLIFLDAPIDRYFAGDDSAVSDSVKRGWILYNGKGRCTACHPMSASNPLGSDSRFHNVGVSARNKDFEKLAVEALARLEKDSSLQTLDELALETPLSELGRFIVTKNYADIGSFRTPQIRNIGITAPYMHDGSMATLWDVMDHYNKGGEANRFLDGGIEPLALTEAEIDDLVAFMFALTDHRFSDLNQAEMERQRKLAAEKRPFRDNDLAHRKAFQFDPRK